MKQTFEYGTYSYEYFIEFGDRKSLTLVVRPDLRIIARVPHGATLDEIEAFLVRKWHWLEKRLAEFRKYRKTHREKQYVSGEALQYLGRQYMLVVEKGDDQVKLERGKLYVYSSKSANNTKHTKQLIEAWYDNRREKRFKREYVAAFELFNYDKMPQLRIRAMSRRWGSYTADNKVSLNPTLIQAPSEAIYYVCIHELCHVTNRKHDELFYEELEKRIPNWRSIKERLEIRYG